jgi:alpha-tubulin suppressor-like RCC1 family protein
VLRRQVAILALGSTISIALIVGATEPLAASQIASLAAGGQHSCSLTAGGSVSCWGHNAHGQLGDGTTTQHTVPTAVPGLGSGVTAIAIGGWHSCALTTGGAVKCWGQNWAGQVGDGSTTQRNTPVDVAGLSSGVAAISAGLYHTCALMMGGSVKCWGFNIYGQAGDGSTTNRSSPADVAGLNATSLAVGGQHTCALTSSGGVKCWGANWNGQVGDGTRSNRLTPTDVSDLTSAVGSVTAGENHSCAVTTTGAAKCWGSNNTGEIGDGTAGEDRLTPVTVFNLSSGVAALSGGGAHTCARTTGGAAKCWGWDGFGQIGDGGSLVLTGYQTTPVDVTGLTANVATISAGSAHNCALKTAGVVTCWGWNSNGQLGDGTTDSRAGPVNMDFDRDGCTDERELQTASGSQTSGGRRNPKLFWDFFDVPTGSPLGRDGVVTSTGDVAAVQARFGTQGDPNGDPLSTPPPTGYHTAYDRTLAGPNSWNTGAPNGSITIQDISYVNSQVGHSCL